MMPIFETWRTYLKENKLLLEKINLLSSNKRYINNILIEIGPEDSRRDFPLSEDELNKIKSIANLQGEPDFLGSGSKGTAWQFNDKVLKITSDSSEAEAANLIIGENNPNVYKIYLVAKRDLENNLSVLRHMPYVIVYELLDYPNNAMVDVTELLFHKVRTNNIYYFWKEYYLEDAKSAARHFLEYINENPESLGAPQKHQSIIPKLKDLSEQIGLNEEETEVFVIFWTLTRGAYNDTLDSALNVTEHVRKMLTSPKLDYLNQLSLGLTWLKENGIRFRDLKTSNIMEKNNQAAIIDIGYSSVSQKKAISTVEELKNEMESSDENSVSLTKELL